jgi:hypothetical protein
MLHAPQDETTQLAGQWLSLQLRSSLKLGQTVPLCADFLMMERVRDCLPPPHVWLQVL